MTQRRIIGLATFTAVLIVVGSLFSYTGIPRGIKVVSDKVPVKGLTVKIIGDAGQEEIRTTDDSGVAYFGRGPWARPLDHGKLILAVVSEAKTEWEGVVERPHTATITIPIDENDSP
jgi:hypothetical protein